MNELFNSSKAWWLRVGPEVLVFFATNRASDPAGKVTLTLDELRML